MQVGLKGHGLKISDGGLPDVYVVEQFHFHWGSENARGSEHEINGAHFPIEVLNIIDVNFIVKNEFIVGFGTKSHLSLICDHQVSTEDECNFSI